jgi:hypothetical protein
MTDQRWPCPCCGHRTLAEEPPGTYLICPVCFWEDDPIQFDDVDRRGGANSVSLVEARRNVRSFGASDERALPHVRRALPNEHP